MNYKIPLDHAAAQLENMTPQQDESLHLYINKCSKMHYAATNKTTRKYRSSYIF